MRFRFVGVISVVLAMVQAAQADVIGFDSFSGTETLIDFEDIAPNEPVMGQYSELGLYVFGGGHGDPFPGTSINGTRELTNFGSWTAPSEGLILYFDHVVHRAGFFATQFGYSTTLGAGSIVGVYALLSGTIVFYNPFVVGGDDGGDYGGDVLPPGTVLPDGTVFAGGNTLPGGSLASVFVGLEVDGGFDALVLIAEQRLIGEREIGPALSIDDLRFEALTVLPVPVPAAILLLGGGLAMLASLARRREKTASA
jgi:hypothetical protein